MKQIDLIKQKCKDAGLKLKPVFEAAGVPYDTILNWKRSEPKAFETVEKINNAIEKLKDEKRN